MRITVFLLLSVISVASVACGGKQSLRDSDVYAAEIQWAEMANGDQLEALRQFIDAYCVCSDAAPDALCETAQETYVVVSSRAPYHLDMMRYNGRLTDERPPESPPAIPDYPPHEVTCNE